MEETALSIQEIVKPEDLFDPLFQQGRVEPKERTWASLLDPYKLTKDSFKSEEELRQAQRFSHENGIFGAYCLEDVRSISHLVLSKYPQSCLSYDCFNYETVKEITLDKQVIRSNTAPADHINMYYQNSILLRQLMKEGKLNFTVHYHDKRNDLLQKIKAKLRLETDWLNSIAYIPKT